MQYTLKTYPWLDEPFLLEWFDEKTGVHIAEVYLKISEDYPEGKYQYLENARNLGYAQAEELPI